MPPVSKYRRRGCVAIPTAVFCLLGTALAFAQDSTDMGDPWSGVEEMIVTGGNVLEALTSTSMSVTAFDSADLAAFGASDVSDVAAFTPNLEIRTAGSTTATLFIRGVGLNDFTANASGSVAVYEDDVPKNLPAIQLGQLYDLEGLTILKGPQGSGPGRNASAGAIKVYTKKPSGDLGGFVQVDYGNYNFVNAQGALEIPILPDVLSTRAAFSLERRDGLVKNRCAGITQEQIDTVSGLCGNNFSADLIPGVADDLNNRDVWSARLTTRWLPPVDEMSWLFSVHGSQLDQLGTVGEHIGANQEFGGTDALGYVQPELAAERARIRSRFPSTSDCRRQNPGDPTGRTNCVRDAQASTREILSDNLASRPLDTQPFEGAFNRPGYERQSSWGGFLIGDWELDAFRIKSSTGFERYDRERLIDADYSPNIIFEFDIEDDAWQASQDIQISGELEDTPLSWNTGLFFLAETLDYEQDTLSRQPGPVEPSSSNYVQDTLSFGVFAEFEWDFLDDFTLKAGGRYNWEQKRFAAEIVTSPAQNPRDRCQALPDGVVPKCQRTVTLDHPTGTVTLDYAIDESRTVYMKYSHGWKGAQFNARNGRGQLFVTDVADPEVIDAFEIGFSGSWWEDRISVNGSFFWYQYKNYQVFTFTNNSNETPQRVVINADNAELYGAELESRFEPVDGLVAELRVGWLESRFLDFTDAVVRRTESQGNRRIVADFNGNPLPNAPRFKVSGNVSYDLELGSLGTLTPRYDFNWSDDVFFDPSGGTGSPNADGNTFLPDNTIGQEALILHNIRLTYATASGGLEFAGWIRNLTNEVYKTLAFDASAGPGLVGNLLGDPRTYGLSAKVIF
jgi:iron complex outermembrane receptor protein